MITKRKEDKVNDKKDEDKKIGDKSTWVSHRKLVRDGEKTQQRKT